MGTRLLQIFLTNAVKFNTVKNAPDGNKIKYPIANNRHRIVQNIFITDIKNNKIVFVKNCLKKTGRGELHQIFCPPLGSRKADYYK